MVTIKSLISLKGRRGLITGAAGYLGNIMAETLAELGADIVLVDRPGADLDSQITSLRERWGIHVEGLTCDLERDSQRAELLSSLRNNKKGLNILINNAAFVGMSQLDGWGVPFEAQSIDTWRRALEVNLTAVFDLSKGLTAMLRYAEGSCIINIASIYGMYGPDWSMYEGTDMSNPAAYGASKGGLIQFTRWLSTTLAPHIRVNSISPGGIFRNQPETFVNRYELRTPMGRMATEDDFRGSIAFLASDLSGYITGQNLVVDGGWGVL